MKFISSTFRMSQTCFKKCVVTYKEGDLSVGESTCVDRCVGKYMQAAENVEALMKRMDQQMQAQENAAAAFKGNK